MRAVCGCWAQTEPGAAEGAGRGHSLGQRGQARLCGGGGARGAGGRFHEQRGQAPLSGASSRTCPRGAFRPRPAYLKLEDGCQNFCSYCVIPYARGRVRSLPPERAAEKAAGLAASGYRELVLTGIEIASYGRGPARHAGPGGRRWRPSRARRRSCGCAWLPGAHGRDGGVLRARLAALGRVCGHFHLSLQSARTGSSRGCGEVRHGGSSSP